MSKQVEVRWSGPADIAWCDEHGLHGARDHCFECGKPVEQIRMVPIDELIERLEQRAQYCERAAEFLTEGTVSRSVQCMAAQIFREAAQMAGVQQGGGEGA